MAIWGGYYVTELGKDQHGVDMGVKLTYGEFDSKEGGEKPFLNYARTRRAGVKAAGLGRKVSDPKVVANIRAELVTPTGFINQMTDIGTERKLDKAARKAADKFMAALEAIKQS